MDKVTFITGNAGKLREVNEFLGFKLKHIDLDLPEIQSLDPREIVKDKIERARKKIKGPILIEDASLTFPAFGKLPGPLVKWFYTELGPEGLCRMVDGKSRECIAQVLYGYFDGKKLHFFEGTMKGSVAEHPQGDGTFGWQSIFIPEGMSKTYGELTDDERRPFAMRRVALDQFKKLFVTKSAKKSSKKK